jgi:Tfp pilus assembly protein PilX
MELSLLKKIVNITKDKKGYILIIIIVILLVISLLLGVVLSLNFTSRAKSLQFNIYRAQSLYIAEAGVREVMWYLKYGQIQPPNYIEIDFENWKGRAEMVIQQNTPQQGKTTITSTGKVPYNSSQRVIKVVIDSATLQIENWEEVTLEYIQ